MADRKYDPDSYETVKERKSKFYDKYPDGRIVVTLKDTDYMDFCIVEASVFTCRDDQASSLPRGTGYALEVRDKELSVSKYGKQYESVNYSSWLENCEESAIGRALDNAGFSGNKKCSREEIEKVDRNTQAIKNRVNRVNMVFGDDKGKPVSECTNIADLKSHAKWGKASDELKKACQDRLNELSPFIAIENNQTALFWDIPEIQVEETEFDFGDNLK